MSPTVLHFRESFPAVTETFIARQLEGLDHDNRWTPWVACRYRKAESAPIPEDRIISLDGTEGPEGALAGKFQRLARNRLGLIDPAREMNALLTPKNLERIRATEPALVHAHFGDGAWMALPLVQALGVPLVATFYGYDMSVFGQRAIWRRRYNQLFANAAACIAEGSCMLATLQDLGCPPDKTRLIRNPVDPDSITFRQRAFKDAKTTAVDLLFIGRFVEKKGLPIALSAMARLRERHPKLHLNIVGDGETRVAIEAQITAEGLNEIVTLHGLLPYEKTRELMEQCDALIVPSRTASNGDSEGGAPNVLLDAQCAGMPIVATRHCDIPEFVVPGESAILARENDAEDFTRAIGELLERTDWGAMGTAGRRWVESEFSQKSVVAKLNSLYESVT